MIKAKLHSRRGATLLFALVALAVAVTVCAVVIFAAQSSAGRVRAAQNAQQNQLTLNSAASLFRQELAGVTLKLENTSIEKTVIRQGNEESREVTPGTQQVTFTQLSDTGGVLKTASGTPENPELRASLTPLQQQVMDWVRQAATADYAQSGDACKKILRVEAEGLEPVTVTLRMEPGKTADMTPDEADAADAEKYYLTAEFALNDRTEAIRISFMATAKDSTATSLRSNTQGTDENGKPYSQREVERHQTIEISWNHASVVVNVTDGRGNGA